LLQVVRGRVQGGRPVTCGHLWIPCGEHIRRSLGSDAGWGAVDVALERAGCGGETAASQGSPRRGKHPAAKATTLALWIAQGRAFDVDRVALVA
jgi:hypothetical protein